MSKQSISQYEQGKGTPSPEHAEKLAQLLRLPIRYFLESEASEDPAPIYWRSMAAATKVARARARRRYDWIRRVVRYLSDYVEFPALNLPIALSVTEPAVISDQMIEDAAAETRRHFGLGCGAIDNMTWLLENNGIIIGFAELEAATLDAFSQMCGDHRAFAIVNSEQGSAVRFRFDLAHELGHMVLHRNLDPRFFSSPVRNSLMENQAHHFAAEFLMPSTVFARNFRATTVEGLKLTKRAWKVSMQAALVHANRIGLVSESQYQHMWRTLSARGYRRKEPLDEYFQPEQPVMLRSAFETLLSANPAMKDELLVALPYHGNEIEQMCGLPSGTLVDHDAPAGVFDIGLSQRQRPPALHTRDSRPITKADILEFPGSRGKPE